MARQAGGDGGEGRADRHRQRRDAVADRAPGQAHGGAGELSRAHRRSPRRQADRGDRTHQQDQGSRHLPQVEHRAGRTLRGNSDPLPRPPQRPRVRVRHGDRQGVQPRLTRGRARRHRRLHARPRHDGARRRGPELPQIVRRLRHARPLVRHRRRDQGSGQRGLPRLGQRRDPPEREHEGSRPRYPRADRIRLDVLHALSGRHHVHRLARRRQPGVSGRRIAFRLPAGRRVQDQDPRLGGTSGAGPLPGADTSISSSGISGSFPRALRLWPHRPLHGACRPRHRCGRACRRPCGRACG